eukprot:4987391-Amphidinium_carterae.1
MRPAHLQAAPAITTQVCTEEGHGDDHGSEYRHAHHEGMCRESALGLGAGRFLREGVWFVEAVPFEAEADCRDALGRG